MHTYGLKPVYTSMIYERQSASSAQVALNVLKSS